MRPPADVDDTSLAAVELARHVRLARRDLVEIACKRLLRARLQGEQVRSPWVKTGAFMTWLHADGQPSLVDCTINANVVAMLALAGTKHLPGFEAACATVAAGVDWAGGDAARHWMISPYYPTAGELLLAIRHAVACGAEDLVPAERDLARCILPDTFHDDSVVFSGAGVKFQWRSPVLQQVRREVDRLGAETRLTQFASNRVITLPGVPGSTETS